MNRARTNWRKQKRYESRQVSAVEVAWHRGCETGDDVRGARRPVAISNPYPRGKRHDEWNRGFETSVDHVERECWFGEPQ
mgnify:CR=1 FL=1